jgi:2-hydroxychromene-2-carboxylate isomerase
MSYGADEFEMLVSRLCEALEMSGSALGAQLQVRAIRNALHEEASAAQKRGNFGGAARLLEAAMALRALA